MTRRTLPAVLSLTLVGALLAAADAWGEDAPVSAGVENGVPAASPPAAKSSAGSIPVTRSDGSTGHTKLPDQKEIRKLVGYMRDGMNRADRADKQKETRRVIQYRRVIKIRK
jgi:hypothetical protein